jgi:tol-pal system protein YbgF
MTRLNYWVSFLFFFWAPLGCFFSQQSRDANRDLYEIKIQLSRLQEIQNDTYKLLESWKTREEQRNDSQFNSLIGNQAEIEKKLQILQEEIRTLRLHLEGQKAGLAPADSKDGMTSEPQIAVDAGDDKQANSVDAEAFLNSARIHFSNGQYARARVSLDRFLELYPSSPHSADAMFLLADTYFYENNFQEAGRLFLKLSVDFPDYARIPDSLVKTAICQIKLGQKQEAREILQKVIKDFPRYEDLTRVHTMLQDLNE